GFGDDPETESLDHGRERGGITHRGRNSPQMRAKLHVLALDVEPAGALGGGRALANVEAQPAATKQHPLSPRDRIFSEQSRPAASHRVRAKQGWRHGLRVDRHVKPGHLGVRPAHDAEARGERMPPRDERLRALAALVLPNDREDRLGIFTTRWLDAVEVDVAREEPLTHSWVLEEVEDVRGGSPERGAMDIAGGRREMTPG